MLPKNQAHTTPLKQKEITMKIASMIALAVGILEVIKEYMEKEE